MEERINRMWSRGAFPEQLHVEHVGQPREGMPVITVPRAKRPGNAFPSQATLNLGIGRNESRIVKVDEAAVDYWPEDAEGYQA